MAIRRFLMCACLGLSLLLPNVSVAQRTLDLERFRPGPDRHSFLGFPGTRTPGHWAWNVALWTNYSAETLTVRDLSDGSESAVMDHRVGTDVITQVGVTDRIAFTLNLPVTLWQNVNASAYDGGVPFPHVALRDPQLGMRVRVLGDGASAQDTRNEGGGVALGLSTTIPIGLENSFAGEGNPQIEGSLIGDFHIFDFGIGGFVNYRHRFAEPELLGARFRNELLFGVGLKFPSVFEPTLSGILEARFATTLDDEVFRATTSYIEGDLGLRWTQGSLSMSWAVGMGFYGGPGTPAFRGVFGISYAPRNQDADGDGLSDNEDECDSLAEDFDNFRDEDGCPDPDNDGDLVPDIDDACPDEASDPDRDENDDGCTDPAPPSQPPPPPEEFRSQPVAEESNSATPTTVEGNAVTISTDDAVSNQAVTRETISDETVTENTVQNDSDSAPADTHEVSSDSEEAEHENESSDSVESPQENGAPAADDASDNASDPPL